MNDEQIKQVAESTEQAIVDVTQHQLAKNVNKLRKKHSFNYNMIIGFAGAFVLIITLFAANLKLNSVVNTIKEDNAGTAAVVTGAVTGIQESIELGDADILSAIDSVETGIGEIKDSVAKIPTKPVVITKAPVVTKAQKYNNCIKWATNAKMDAANTKLYMDACLNLLK